MLKMARTSVSRRYFLPTADVVPHVLVILICAMVVNLQAGRMSKAKNEQIDEGITRHSRSI